MDEPTTERARKRPGPIATPGRVRTTIYLDEELTEWGKRQPGGLSEFVRRLMTEERRRAGGSAA